MSNGNVSEESVVSTLHHALRAARRRAVIVMLVDDPDWSVSVRELAKQIAAREENVPLEEATGEPYRNVYNALSQTHLPMLSDADIIIYDSDRQVVTPGKQISAAKMLVALGPPVVQTLLPELSPDPMSFDRQSTIE
jgi:hypothetical protein